MVDSRRWLALRGERWKMEDGRWASLVCFAGSVVRVFLGEAGMRLLGCIEVLTAGWVCSSGSGKRPPTLDAALRVRGCGLMRGGRCYVRRVAIVGRKGDGCGAVG